MSDKSPRNPVTAALFGMRPPGFQIEARSADNYMWTDYRFTRLSDGTWCQERLDDVVAYSARSPHAVAAMLLKVALAKFDDLKSVSQT